jgi:hypothetical protein
MESEKLRAWRAGGHSRATRQEVAAGSTGKERLERKGDRIERDLIWASNFKILGSLCKLKHFFL